MKGREQEPDHKQDVAPLPEILNNLCASVPLCLCVNKRGVTAGARTLRP